MSDVDDLSDNSWLLLQSHSGDGKPLFVGVVAHLPPLDVRRAFPVRIEVSIEYEADENGLPLYSDDLATLNDLERDFRSWDPECRVFRNAMRLTGDGQRCWILYATKLEAFESLLPENDFIVVRELETDPAWTDVADVLRNL